MCPCHTVIAATDAPAQKHRILRKLLPGSLQPVVRGIRKRFFDPRRPRDEPYRTVFPYAAAHRVRQENLLRLALDIDTRGVPGAIVECGVLDGGTAALMAFGTSKSSREVHLFDSWQGLPDTTEKDGDAAKAWAGDVVGSQARVRAVMRKLNIDPDRLTFHKGWFDQTFPKAGIDKVALVHVDADFYASVRLSIETWFPKLSPGGYMQFDDYLVFLGCTRAVDEFLLAKPELKLEQRDDLAFYIRKPELSADDISHAPPSPTMPRN
jgi:O-methyltransferase